MVRVTGRAWLSLGILVATLLASLGPATNAPAHAAASTAAPAAPSAKIPHTHLPPRDFVPAPLRHAGAGTVMRFHGRRILIPAQARLIPALRTLLFGAPTSDLRAPGPPQATPNATPSAGRHTGLQRPLAPHALATSSVTPSPPPPVSIDAVQGRFYFSPHNSTNFTAADGLFDIQTGTAPLFTQQFPNLDFNPPASAQHCSNPITVNGSVVTEYTRPFVDVIPQPDGTCTLAIAQGNGAQAGVDLSGQGGPNLTAFEAVFTARLTVAQAGPLTLHFFSDDGWVFAIGHDAAGDQPTRDPSSPSESDQAAPGYNVPTSGFLTGYPVVGADDQATAPVLNQVTVDFPAAGTYPVEVDYTECCQGQLALTLGSQYGDPLLPGTISSLPGDQNRCPCSQAQPFRGHPFNTRTGNLDLAETDLAVTSPGPALDWVRTYNSQATGDADQPGALGYGWQVPYLTHVITAGAPGGEPGVAIIASGTGNRDRFVDLGGGRFEPFPGVYATLVQAEGVYTETLRTQEQVTFNAAGQATAIGDGHGGRLALQYAGTRLTRIVDAANPDRYLALDYDPTGTHIVAVHDPTGRTMQYRYADNGDLVGTTDVLSRTATYHYQNHLLTEADNTLGQPLERNTYDVDDATGKLIGQTLADGQHLDVAYAADATTITTTGTDGTQDVEQVLYDAQRNTMLGLVENGTLVQQTTFDSTFAPSLVVDAYNHATTTINNAMGLPVQAVNALGATSQVQYDEQNRPITATDPLNRQTVFVYDAQNNLVRQTMGITTDFPLGQTTVYTYNVRYPGQNWLEDLQAPNGVVTHNEYNAAGQLITATVGYGTDQAQTTTYGYDEAGRPVTATVGVGTPLERRDVTRYNADNTLAQVIQNDKDGVFDPAHADADVSTAFGYDALGQTSWERDALGHYDVLHHDAGGRVDWTVRNLSPVQLDAQGQPLIPATPPAFSAAQSDANVATFYGYDGLGRQALITQTGILTGTFDTTTRTFSAATTRVTRTEYDAFDNPVTTTLNYRPDLPALPDANVQTVTQYDLAGNVTGQRDALGRWTTYQDDALNRPVTTTVNYENGNPLTIDPANQSWTDGTDSDLVQVTRYRPDNSVAQTIDNYVDGTFTASAPITDRITQYDYDGQGRVITTTVNADPATVATRTDTNRQTVAAYDPLSGQVLGQRDTLGRWTSDQYDPLGRVTATIQNCRDASGVPAAQGCAPFDASTPDRNVASQTRYDALGRPFETVDQLGHVTHTVYDGLGQQSAVTENYVAGAAASADTNVTTAMAYYALGRTTVTTDAVGAATVYGSDALGQTVAVTDPVGRVSRSGEDGTGMLRWSATPDGRFTVLQVDGLGRVVATIQNYHGGSVGPSTPPDQDLTTRTVYDAAGRRLQTVDSAGHVTAYTYDLRDHVTSVEKNVQSTCAATATDCNVLTQYAYDRAGHRVSTTDPRGNTTHFRYDAADEQTATIDALNRPTTREYDAGGRVSVQHDPRGSADDLSYSYDGLDRLTQLAAPNLPAPIQASYDALGERTRLSDGTGTTSFSYDAVGHMTGVTAPGTGALSYGYDANGQRTSLRYPDGATLGYGYGLDGQLKSVTQGSTTLAGYAYDSAGRLQQVSRLNGALTSYSYDGADRLRDLSTTISGTVRSDFQYDVDRLGARTTVTETLPLTTTSTPPLTGTGTCAAYPIALSAKTLAGVAVSTTISSIANGTQPGNLGWLTWTGNTTDPTLVTSLTPPGDSATYVNPADPTDHVLAVGKSVRGRPGVANSSGMRAALDRLKTLDITVPVWDTTSGSGSAATYHVSAFAKVRLLDYQLAGNKDLLSLRFLGYTACGAAPSGSPTPTSTPAPITTTRVITYAYDGLQRLTDAVESPGTAYHYGYDLAGNRTDVVVNGVLDTHHDYDAANQVLGWGYDAAGNVMTDTARSYTYDALNRLTGLTQGPEQRAYAYNGDSTLISQTVNGVATLFTQDLAAPQSQVLQTQATGGTPTDYLYGLDRLAAVSGSTRTWYGTDGQGSVRYLLDDAGNTRAPRSYDPFGTPEGAQMPDPFGYTGELQDGATGLLSLRARWYDPAAGQFFSRDPLEGETGQAYSYAGDDPVNNGDPSGQCTFRNGHQTVDLSGLDGSGPCGQQVLASLRAQGGDIGRAAERNPTGVKRSVNAALSSLQCELRDPSAERTLAAGGSVTVAEPLNPGQVLTQAEQRLLETVKARFPLGDVGEVPGVSASEIAGATEVATTTLAAVTWAEVLEATFITFLVLNPEIDIVIGAVVLGGMLFILATAHTPTATPQAQPAPASTPAAAPLPTAGTGTAPPVATPTPNSEPNWVVRAGISTAQQLKNGYACNDYRGAVGVVCGASVQYAPGQGKTIEELAIAGRFPNKQISYATDMQLFAAGQAVGYDIRLIKTPARTIYHHDLSAVNRATGAVVQKLPDDLANALSQAFLQNGTLPNPQVVPRP